MPKWASSLFSISDNTSWIRKTLHKISDEKIAETKKLPRRRRWSTSPQETTKPRHRCSYIPLGPHIVTQWLDQRILQPHRQYLGKEFDEKGKKKLEEDFGKGAAYTRYLSDSNAENWNDLIASFFLAKLVKEHVQDRRCCWTLSRQSCCDTPGRWTLRNGEMDRFPPSVVQTTPNKRTDPVDISNPFCSMFCLWHGVGWRVWKNK